MHRALSVRLVQRADNLNRVLQHLLQRERTFLYGQRSTRIFREELLWFDDAKSPYFSKVLIVERGCVARTLQGGCPDKQVTIQASRKMLKKSSATASRGTR